MSDDIGKVVLLGTAAAALGTLLYNLFGAEAGKATGQEKQKPKSTSKLAVVKASASGKVLITGGYLVLERANTGRCSPSIVRALLYLSKLSDWFDASGLVLSVSANFYTHVAALPDSITSKHLTLPSEAADGTVPIVVYCPQRCAQPSVYQFNPHTFELKTVGCALLCRACSASSRLSVVVCALSFERRRRTNSWKVCCATA